MKYYLDVTQHAGFGNEHYGKIYDHDHKLISKAFVLDFLEFDKPTFQFDEDIEESFCDQVCKLFENIMRRIQKADNSTHTMLVEELVNGASFVVVSEVFNFQFPLLAIHTYLSRRARKLCP